VDKLLYVAMSGASQNSLALRAHANNLANVATSGFRRDFEQARAMPVYGDGFPARAYAMSERPATDFASATLQETGNSMDVAIRGDGWLAVQAKDGSEAYVRCASLIIDPLGQLRTQSGLPVLGNGGPIAIPPHQSLEIGQDGTISIRPSGSGASALAQIDRLKLVKTDNRELKKGLDGLIRRKDGEELPADGEVQVTSGFLESSNVNAVAEMTSILALARQFELSVKMMKSAEDDDAALAQIMRS